MNPLVIKKITDHHAIMEIPIRMQYDSTKVSHKSSQAITETDNPSTVRRKLLMSIHRSINYVFLNICGKDCFILMVILNFQRKIIIDVLTELLQLATQRYRHSFDFDTFTLKTRLLTNNRQGIYCHHVFRRSLQSSFILSLLRYFFILNHYIFLKQILY